jgi:hypothetical protein
MERACASTSGLLEFCARSHAHGRIVASRQTAASVLEEAIGPMNLLDRTNRCQTLVPAVAQIWAQARRSTGFEACHADSGLALVRIGVLWEIAEAQAAAVSGPKSIRSGAAACRQLEKSAAGAPGTLHAIARTEATAGWYEDATGVMFTRRCRRPQQSASWREVRIMARRRGGQATPRVAAPAACACSGRRSLTIRRRRRRGGRSLSR